MGTYLNPGNKMFQKSLDGSFYVDKTELATYLNERMGTSQALVCVSRPRRFGKTVDADMLVAYYSKGAESRMQFDGLSVSRSPLFEEHLNSHDVVKVNVQNLVRPAGGFEHIEEYLSSKLIEELCGEWPSALPPEISYLPEALELVEHEKGSGFVFVIDEWDCVFRVAPEYDFAQRDYLDFLRDLLKDRSYVDACYMTGILPIKKYGRHSALNLFTEYSVIDPKDLAHLMGFNADEVERLCARFDVDYGQMASWYDGYLLGEERIHVYNPRSVAGAISSGKFSSYWSDTETYEALQRYVDIDFDGVAADLVSMLDGAHVATNVGIYENDMATFASKDDVYALLVHLGYLGYDQAERAVFIPNEEIRREFASAIQTGKRPQLARLVADSRELLECTLEGDEEFVADALDRAHSQAATPLHYNNEQALRAAVKLAYLWAIDDYLRVDELPSGKGFADVAFISKPGLGRPAMIVELKWNEPADAAIARIKARNYPQALDGVSGECVLVGVSYDAKSKVHSGAIERVSL